MTQSYVKADEEVSSSHIICLNPLAKNLKYFSLSKLELGKPEGKSLFFK